MTKINYLAAAPPPVNSGNSGDIFRCVLETPTRSWLNQSSYGDGRSSRRFGSQFATAPICSGTRSGYGWEIGPRRRGPEIARQCGAAVGQERPSGKPGGLSLLRLSSRRRAASRETVSCRATPLQRRSSTDHNRPTPWLRRRRSCAFRSSRMIPRKPLSNRVRIQFFLPAPSAADP